MKVFGEPYDAPAFHGRPHVPVPFGAQCYLCEHLIEEDDRGVVLPSLEVMQGEPRCVERPAHLWCHLRSALGPVEHVLDPDNCPNHEHVEESFWESAQRLKEFLEARR